MNRHSYIYLFLVLAWLLKPGIVLCQKTGADSLKDMLQYAGSDTEKANILIKVAGYYKSQREFKEGMPYALQALKLAQAKGSIPHIAKTAQTISLLYWNNGQTDSALIFSKLAESNYLTAGNYKKLISVYTNT